MIFKKIPFLLFTLLFLGSCLARTENSGYSFDLTDYKIKKGISSKDEIIKNMGSPTLISSNNDEVFWIYFEEKIRKLLFFKPTTVSRKITLITFNQNNIVKEVSNYSLSDEKNIKFSDKKTAVTEIKKGLLEDLFGNIGTVRPQ